MHRYIFVGVNTALLYATFASAAAAGLKLCLPRGHTSWKAMNNKAEVVPVSAQERERDSLESSQKGDSQEKGGFFDAVRAEAETTLSRERELEMCAAIKAARDAALRKILSAGLTKPKQANTKRANPFRIDE
jgi:hypothetical protein